MTTNSAETRPGAAPSAQRLDSLQYLRAAAALAVLVHHALQHANGAVRGLAPDWLTTAGAGGVDVFFVISGFVMVWIAFRQAGAVPAPARFMADRMARILPPYWACCAVVLAVCAAGFLRQVDRSAWSVAASLALVPHPGRLVGAGWTLEYEMLFYLIFALWLPLRRAGRCLLACALTIVLVGVAARGLGDGPARRFLSDPIMLEFCAGMGLGWLYLHRPGALRVPGIAALAALGTMMLMPLIAPPETTDGLRGWTRVLGWGLPAVVIVGHAIGANDAGRAVLPAVLRALLLRLGNASYALYLSHGFLLIGYAAVLKRTALREQGQGPVVLLLVMAACVVAVVLHERVEAPLAAQLRRWMRRSSTAPCRPDAAIIATAP